ncbi:hypothetical protein PHYPSEUDO_006576 [Phytophthora pseudosyringae]|uniref:Uncharacterized protein n=1 Tax=Phytophthora pseudosyringae TaxID=221518 RepID=A0A8T1VLA0_9STRA|nr:hypothetical protein PHYPSEUDO_006576 [Phytophthora pseudosyringae]
MQQSANAQFLAVPPVCRCLLDFGFGAHGLTVMYYRPVDLWDRVQAQDSNVSFTDFSERNTLRPEVSASSRSDVFSALRSLRVFARHFYNDAVQELIDGASSFIDSYKGVSDTDAVSWKLLAFWVTSKFSMFRRLIISRDFDAAQEVWLEFSLTDEEFLELLDLRRSHHVADPSHRSPPKTNRAE